VRKAKSAQLLGYKIVGKLAAWSLFVKLEFVHRICAYQSIESIAGGGADLAKMFIFFPGSQKGTGGNGVRTEEDGGLRMVNHVTIEFPLDPF